MCVPLLEHVSGSVPRPSLSPLRYSLQFEVAMSQWARESESNLASWPLDSRCHDSVEAARCCYPVFYLGRTTKQWSKSPSTISATSSTTSTQLNSTQLNLPSNQSGEANGWFKTSSQSTGPTINTGLPCTPHAWLPQLRTGRCHHGQAARMPHQCHLVHSEHPSIQLSLRDMICTTRYAHR